MKRILPFIVCFLASCAGDVAMKPDGSVVIHGPLMARADRLAVNAKTSIGEVRVLLVNGNSESVPNTLIGTAGTAIGLGIAGSVQKSNNALTATQSNNAASIANTTTKANAAVKTATIKATPTITSPPQTVTFPP